MIGSCSARGVPVYRSRYIDKFIELEKEPLYVLLDSSKLFLLPQFRGWRFRKAPTEPK